MSKNNRKSARKPATKIHYQHTGKNLTSQAGVIPVMRFLDHIGFDQACRKHLDLQRADNDRYSLGDSTYLTVIGMITGATSLMKVVSVWADQVLREVGGWLSIPDDSTLSGISWTGWTSNRGSACQTIPAESNVNFFISAISGKDPDAWSPCATKRP